MSHIFCSFIFPLLPFFVLYKILMYHFNSAIDFLIIFFLSLVFKEYEELGIESPRQEGRTPAVLTLGSSRLHE